VSDGALPVAARDPATWPPGITILTAIAVEDEVGAGFAGEFAAAAVAAVASKSPSADRIRTATSRSIIQTAPEQAWPSRRGGYGSGRVTTAFELESGGPSSAYWPTGAFGTILADPPWRFANRTGKVAPEHRRLARYDTLELEEICDLPVAELAAARSHLYLWVPNALLAEGLRVMDAWRFTYKANVVWHKVRKDGGSDGRGVGFYFRNVTELVLFGVRGSLRTGPAARSQVNLIASRKREHSRKPDELYGLIEACSPGPYLELFARYPREGWTAWGDEAAAEITPRGRRHRAYGASR
jgi:N6-adenosine-specific RNA methylase IME4